MAEGQIFLKERLFADDFRFVCNVIIIKFFFNNIIYFLLMLERLQSHPSATRSCLDLSTFLLYLSRLKGKGKGVERISGGEGEGRRGFKRL